MKGINLIWIIPVCLMLGGIVGFVIGFGNQSLQPAVQERMENFAESYKEDISEMISEECKVDMINSDLQESLKNVVVDYFEVLTLHNEACLNAFGETSIKLTTAYNLEIDRVRGIADNEGLAHRFSLEKMEGKE